MTAKEEYNKNIELLLWDLAIGMMDKSADEFVKRVDLLSGEVAVKTCAEIIRVLKNNRPKGDISYEKVEKKI